MTKAPTVHEFFRRFPDDATCLDHVMTVRYGKSLECPGCGVHSKFHRLKKRQVYSCQWCGYQISPMEGTPFERTHTPLTKWFYAMYLFTTSRHGVPAKELQRQLGVTYKTAWRMGHELRKHMANVDGDPPLGGHVEADETYVGGRTDELHSYAKIARYGYRLGRVNHSADQWVSGPHHTNSIEGFWSMLKRSIRGTHIHVSRRHLPKYLGEFEFRWNSRHAPETMFARLLMSS